MKYSLKCFDLFMKNYSLKIVIVLWITNLFKSFFFLSKAQYKAVLLKLYTHRKTTEHLVKIQAQS